MHFLVVWESRNPRSSCQWLSLFYNLTLGLQAQAFCDVLKAPLSALLGILLLVMAPLWPNLPLLISKYTVSHIPMGVLWVWTLVSAIWKDTVQFTIPNLWTFNYLLPDLLQFQSINEPHDDQSHPLCWGVSHLFPSIFLGCCSGNKARWSEQGTENYANRRLRTRGPNTLISTLSWLI